MRFLILRGPWTWGDKSTIQAHPRVKNELKDHHGQNIQKIDTTVKFLGRV